MNYIIYSFTRVSNLLYENSETFYISFFTYIYIKFEFIEKDTETS